MAGFPDSNPLSYPQTLSSWTVLAGWHRLAPIGRWALVRACPNGGLIGKHRPERRISGSLGVQISQFCSNRCSMIVAFSVAGRRLRLWRPPTPDYLRSSPRSFQGGFLAGGSDPPIVPFVRASVLRDFHTEPQQLLRSRLRGSAFHSGRVAQLIVSAERLSPLFVLSC